MKGNAKKWDEAVTKAKEEFKEKGIENPNDGTPGYVERIHELYDGGELHEEIKKMEKEEFEKRMEEEIRFEEETSGKKMSQEDKENFKKRYRAFETRESKLGWWSRS